METKLESILEKDELNEWTVGRIDNDRVFVNSQVFNDSELVFCFVSLHDDPFIIAISDLVDQCKKQGFVDESVSQIEDHVHARLRSILDFYRVGGGIGFEVSVASLEVHLWAPVEKVNIQLSSRLLRKVLHNNLQKVSLLQGVTDDLLGLIDSKDKAIQYLEENLQELGGGRISKWAPPGSYNAKSIEKYTPPLELLQCFEDSEDVMEAAESLLKLRPHFRNYTRSPSRSPRKRYRNSGATNLIGKLQEDQTNSTVLSPPQTQSPKRAASDSPSKRQKFGKVKVTKEK